VTRALAVAATLGIAAPAAAHHIPYGDPAVPARVACESGGFRLDALRRRKGVERRRRGGEYRALRRWIRQEKRFGPEFPIRGFRLLSRDDDTVVFGAGHPPRMGIVQFERGRRGRWRFASSGNCLRLRPTHPTGFAAEWRLDPAAPPPTRESIEIPILVQERSCASGQPATGRIEPPRVFADDRRVVVALFVRPDEGLQTCPGNPDTPHVLHLAEPLGDRRLLDGGIIPARKRFPR
jgi:hypothetical protein